MRSDRLTRKTHFRKILKAGLSGKTLFDLTQDDLAEDDRAICLLDDLASAARTGRAGAEGSPLFDCYEDALLWAATLAGYSPTARMLLDHAALKGWAFGLADLKNEGFTLDGEQKLVLLDHFCLEASGLSKSTFFRHVLLTTMIRALRDVWHEEHLHDPVCLYTPEQMLMLERVRAADCDTVTILCGWELRGAGFGDVWRYLLGSEEGDMAIVFTRFLERDPGALFSGAALAYAFRQWYADLSRADGVDHDTLETLDLYLDESTLASPFGHRRLEAGAIEELSILPDGKCYLAGLGEGILRDPFFAGLNDVINQTHLFQLTHDMDAVLVNNVPFRDISLARKIFPQRDGLPVR